MTGGSESASGDSPAGQSVAAGRGYTVGSFTMAGFALALIPPVFGLVGLVFGVVGVRKGDPLGRVSAICCVAATVVGLLFGALLARGQT